VADGPTQAQIDAFLGVSPGGAGAAVPPPTAAEIDAFLGVKPAPPPPSLWDKAMSNSVPGGGGFDPLGWIAKAGGKLNAEFDKEGGDMAEEMGRRQALHGENPSTLAQIANVAPIAIPGTLAEAAIPQNRLSAGLMAAGPIMKAAGNVPALFLNALGPVEEAAEAAPAASAVDPQIFGATTTLMTATPAAKAATEAAKVASSKPGVLASLIQARAGRGISLGTAQYVLDHPEVLENAPSIDEATQKYVEAVQGLKGRVQSIAERLNKTVVTPADYNAAIDRAGRLLRGSPIDEDMAKALTPQDALEGVQTINKALRDKMYTSTMDPSQIGEVLKVKDGLMDYLQNNGVPKIREAATDLFRAHVKDAFSDWLPKNKFGSPDALRTMAGMGQMGTAGALAAAGHPIAAVPFAANAALTSPRVFGGIIQNVAAVPRALPSAGAAVAAGANAAGGPPDQPQAPARAPLSPEEARTVRNVLTANVLNPTKSGAMADQVRMLGLPPTMVSRSGKASLSDVARVLHQAGAIPENDEQAALDYLKRMDNR